MCLPSGDSSAALPADLHLRGPEHRHCAARSQADSQRTIRHLGVGRDPPGQVFQLSAHGTLAGLVAAVGFGLGTGHRHRRLAAAGSPAEADLRGAEERNPHGDLHQGDETRWRVFVILEGKEGYGWWLWVVLGRDTVVYLLDASRSHTVPENHFRAESRGVLVVDRYSAYKAMSWVKRGVLVLAFCWAHVRRDFIRVGKGWPELKTWALEWLRRIRALYRLNDRRLAAERALGEIRGGGWPPAPSRGRDEDADGDGTGPSGSCHTVPEGLGKPADGIGKG